MFLKILLKLSLKRNFSLQSFAAIYLISRLNSFFLILALDFTVDFTQSKWQKKPPLSFEIKWTLVFENQKDNSILTRTMQKNLKCTSNYNYVSNYYFKVATLNVSQKMRKNIYFVKYVYLLLNYIILLTLTGDFFALLFKNFNFRN